jgi:drug/metabolite transporter (DMT)-like permease
MSPLVISLVLASALIHVVWNSLAKANPDKEAFAWLTSVGSLLFLGAASLIGYVVAPGPEITRETLACAALSACFQTAYIILLFKAYSLIDLSVVYPVNRGMAPILVMGAAGFLVGDTVTPLQAVGVAASALGALAVGLTSRTGTGKLSLGGLLVCLLTATATAGYIITDRKAMAGAVPPRPLDYLFLVYLFQGVALTAWVAARRSRLAGFCECFRKNVKITVLVSLFIPLSYLCIIAALEFGNVTLISAGRNVGILMSALAGRMFLRENVSAQRAAGAVCVFAGLVLVALNSAGG